MKKILFIIFSFSFILFGQSYDLVWSDDFLSTEIDTNKWSFDIGTGNNGWGNNELQYYTKEYENVHPENGMLLIIAKKILSGFTSARIKTKDKFYFTYGKAEARIKVPAGKGKWPAFWMLGQNIDIVNWPHCGEIDIMEHINNENKVYGTMHWFNNGHVQYGNNTEADITGFHTYTLEWDRDYLRWYFDGNKFHEALIANGINSTNCFHSPFFMLLNFAVGGNWPGNPDGTSTFPDTLYVDYVKVFRQTTHIRCIDKTSPADFRLYQNYPNPFNPRTKIIIEISKNFISENRLDNQQVSVKIYDLKGNEVLTLVNKKIEPGISELDFESRDLVSGIYFVTMKTAGFSKTIKMILLK